MDPSCTLGFYCRDKADFEMFCAQVSRSEWMIWVSFMQRWLVPLFSSGIVSVIWPPMIDVPVQSFVSNVEHWKRITLERWTTIIHRWMMTNMSFFVWRNYPLPIVLLSHSTSDFFLMAKVTWWIPPRIILPTGIPGTMLISNWTTMVTADCVHFPMTTSFSSFNTFLIIFRP